MILLSWIKTIELKSGTNFAKKWQTFIMKVNERNEV